MSAADPRPRLDITSKYRGPAFRAIERILRDDPTLARVVKTWRTREGFDTDMQMPAFDMLPIVSLSPMPVDSKPLGEGETRVQFDVSVQIAVPGTCVDDILALWEAVEDAIVGSKPFRTDEDGVVVTVHDYLCSVLSSLGQGPRGIIILRPTVPAFFDVDLRKTDNDPSIQWGKGRLTSFLSRPA